MALFEFITIVLLEAIAFLGIVFLQWKYINRMTQEKLQILQERKATFRFIDRLGEKVIKDRNLEDALQTIANFIVETTLAESGAFFLLDEKREYLVARSVAGPFPPLPEAVAGGLTAHPGSGQGMANGTSLRWGEGVIGRAAAEGRPLLIANAAQDSRLSGTALAAAPFRSLILTPLIVHDRALGICVLINKREHKLFSEEDLDLLVSLSVHASITVEIFNLYKEMAEKKKIEQDLQLASEFQRVLLPHETPRIAGFEIAAYSQSARDIGGDYYDFIPIDESHTGIVIADVSGKGIAGALIMSMVRALLREIAQTGLTPRETLKRLNRRLVSDTNDTIFVTMIYGVLDHRRHTFRFARCGHEPVITLAPETASVHLHTPEGIALGLALDDVFDILCEMEIALPPGGMIVLYTDGVIEAMDATQTEYGQARLLRALETHRGSAQSLVDSLTQDVAHFTQGIPQYDDLTMIAIHHAGQEQKLRQAPAQRAQA
ncbi:MAG: SpoIIE family protein phosphatase [Candidatus Sumerlaeota bacterium]|nr:SpoIIE family protein phosphatase [Candidatus Sumerlaeota bacterium]